MLTPERSRASWVWWAALHAALVAAAMLIGAPWAVRALLVAAALGHAILRPPRAPPRTIVVAADGGCLVPGRTPDRLRLGPRTLVCAYWIRLGFAAASPRHDIVLFADQLDGPQWARLRALLLRLRCA